MTCLFPKDLVPSFWRQSVSYRELWAAEHFESLDLDPREPRLLSRGLEVGPKKNMDEDIIRIYWMCYSIYCFVVILSKSEDVKVISIQKVGLELWQYCSVQFQTGRLLGHEMLDPLAMAGLARISALVQVIG